MSNPRIVPPATIPHLRGPCLCLHTHRAARALARRFDEVFRPLNLTSGQFSLLMLLKHSGPSSIGNTAALLAMDRTTLTANLKPLERRGWVKLAVDRADRRSRRLTITRAGLALLRKAYPLWKETHAAVERQLTGISADDLRTALRTLS